MDFSRYKEKAMNALSKQLLKGFLVKHGYYLILFICVCAIGFTAFWTSMNRDKTQQKSEDEIISEEQEPNDVLEQPVQQMDDSKKVEVKIKDVLEKGNTSEAQNQASTQKQSGKEGNNSDQSKVEVNKTGVNGTKTKPHVVQTSASAQSQKSSKTLLQKPVQGQVIMDFAVDHLQYSRTLKEWTTHPGIDIESQLGSQVKAALDGIVESIDEDPLMGIVITIDHGNGLKTRYANLSTKDMVTINQQVKKGQVISGVGRTAISEILDPPHVHFEVLKDSKNVDPKNYLE